MGISDVDQVFWLAGIALELVLVCVLIARGEYRRFPIFLIYLIYSVVQDPTLFWMFRVSSPSSYYQAFLISLVIGSLLELGIVFEIAYKVLRPAQESMPRRVLGALAVILIACFIVTLIWTLDQSGQSKTFELVFVRVKQIYFSFAFLRLGLFALITGCSQMLGITWKNHVIRLAAGLAFYSAVSVVVQLTLSHLPQSNHALYNSDYSLLSHTQELAYFGTLAFWVWAFLQKDAPRREFTPQMEKILVTIAQTAQRNRVNLTRGLGHK